MVSIMGLNPDVRVSYLIKRAGAKVVEVPVGDARATGWRKLFEAMEFRPCI